MNIPLVCVFPHSYDEFHTPQDLDTYLREVLSKDMNGEYLLGKMRRRDKDFFDRVAIGSVVLFRKRDIIVGEGEIKEQIHALFLPVESETENGLPKTYYHKTVFLPSTIRIYKPSLLVTELENWVGHLDPRYYKILGSLTDYRKRFSRFLQKGDA